jgi:hypothetical protein
MDLNKVKKSWMAFADKMNKYGVPLPLVRDAKTGLGSVSLTLVFISFNVVLIGLVGKWAGALGGIDITQALNLFYACAALYWGRKFQGGNSSLGDVEPQKELDQPKKPAPPAAARKPQPVDDPDQQ